MSLYKYYADNHFTCSIVHNNEFWHHNGFDSVMTIQGILAEQGNVYYYANQTAATALYCLVHTSVYA